MSKSPFYRTGVSKSPLHQNELKEAKERLKFEKQYARDERKSGRKAVKKHNAGQYEYINRSEFRANKAEDRSVIQAAREKVKNLKQQQKNN